MMKKIKLLLLFVLPIVCNAQIDSLKHSAYQYLGSALGIPLSNNYYTYKEPIYAAKDTLKCIFLEVLDMDSAITKWTSGYVERKKGFISFGKTSVSDIYLPLTDGIVTSTLFYNDMTTVKNSAIKVVLKPISIKDTNVVGLY